MRVFVLVLVLWLSNTLAHAQSNDIRARSAFLKAQEHYGNAQYGQALEKLDEASQLLGSSNPRIAHLATQCHMAVYNLKGASQTLDTYFKLAAKDDPNFLDMIKRVGELDELKRIDKEYMRDRLFANGIQYPRHLLIADFAEVKDILSADYIHPEYKYPAVFLALLAKDHAYANAYFATYPLSTTIKDPEGHTLLDYAAEAGRLDIVKKLVEMGASPTQKCSMGHEPVHAAARGGAVEVLDYLVAQGASLDASTTSGITVAHSAAFTGQVKVLEYLTGKGVNILTKDNFGRTPLANACLGGSIPTVEFMLKNGASLKESSSYGSLVFDARTVEMMKYLESKGLDIAATANTGSTALRLAAQRGDTDLVRYLHKRGQSLNDSQEGTPTVVMAGYSGSVQTLRYFYDNGVDMLQTGTGGWQVITTATRSGSVLAVKFLQSLGADLTIRNTDQSTLMNHAAAVGSIEMMKYLQSEGLSLETKGYNDWQAIHNAAYSNRVSAFDFLLNSGISRDAKAKWELQPIHTAAMGGAIEVMEVLLRKGANIHSKISDGGTPVIIAANNGQATMVKYLIGKGANMYDKTTNGRNIGYWAANSGSVEVLQYLKEQDINLLATVFSDFGSPLAVAASKGYTEAVNYLLSVATSYYNKKALKTALEGANKPEIIAAISAAMK